MNDLIQTVDWSRAQFALTAMYHWLFVPLTIGLSIIVAVMESIYVRKGEQKWKSITKFWMTLFGINFACGVATGIILEFEFGTNWSNYSWFVGDIFGAPLAIEGIVAFFMEATFVAVMFFGWNKVSRRFHLVSTWLVAAGVSLSALWILIANAWMQNPVGMEFDPAQMRNVMSNFTEVAFNSLAMNKFFHAVFSGWALAGVFVIGVSSWLLWKKRNKDVALPSIKVGACVGLVGLLLTIYTGDGSAVQVARHQPMKLAAMEGLYKGKVGQELVGFGILNPDKKPGDNQEAIHAEISIPYGLSVLANHDANSFVPGIDDLIDGIELTPQGDTIYTDSYAKRIEMGRMARQALADFGNAQKQGNKAAMESAQSVLAENYKYFGYGYLDKPEDAVPPVGLTFYAFRIMVTLGGVLILIFLVSLFSLKWKPAWLDMRWYQWLGMLSIPMVWVCSQAGWIVAEVGRQPWVIQDIMPTGVAVSDISSGSVQTTFWIFAVLFTLMLAAEISIMLRYIARVSKTDMLNNPKL
ncbi:MAG: cytochrome ubiquinol oxidase subunit I [Prevotella sp.]|nr:cytochrome ubiquinol oxidase subunit I [Prevotella sp.]MCM1074219.1 cytochrome ubiquinol oxidase subunit I [Ruminococcus sp.]